MRHFSFYIMGLRVKSLCRHLGFGNTRATRRHVQRGGGWEQMEALGARLLLSVSVAPNGYTLIQPSADSRVIYVSSSQGNDANTGTSANSPVKTIAMGKSLLRYGMPDQLLLKRGDTFNESFGTVRLTGRSATEPQVIGAYGTGARPIIASGTATGIMTSYFGPVDAPVYTSDYLAIVGLDFYADGRDPSRAGADLTSTPTGIYLTTNSHWMLVEDCMVRGFKDNVVIGAGTNTVFRRNVIVDAFATNAHAQGMYIYGSTGTVLEENVFDHNGWREGVPGAEQTIFNHNVYVAGTNGPVTVRGNIFANASSHGLQDRSGGDVIGNLFYNNAIGMSFGVVNGDTAAAGGVSGRIEGNVFVGDHAIAGAARGWAIEVGNTKSKAAGGGTVITGNIITGDTQNAFAAIQVTYGNNVSNPTEVVGVNDLTIEDNIVYKWYQALALNGNLLPGTVGARGLNGLIVSDNQFQLSLTGKNVDHAMPVLTTAETWRGNEYASSDASKSFLVQGGTVGIDTWVGSVEPTAVKTQVVYPDPDRTLAGYNATLGGAADADAFLQRARQLSASSYDAEATAEGMIDYMQVGFGMQAAPVVCVLPGGVPLVAETDNGGSANSAGVAPSAGPPVSAVIPVPVAESTAPVPDLKLLLDSGTWNSVAAAILQSMPASLAETNKRFKFAAIDLASWEMLHSNVTMLSSSRLPASPPDRFFAVSADFNPVSAGLLSNLAFGPATMPNWTAANPAGNGQEIDRTVLRGEALDKRCRYVHLAL